MAPDIATPDTAAPGASVGVPEKPSLDGLEDKWIARWADEDTYAFDRAAALQAPRDQIHSIDTPPPTASGSLHVGHVFSFSHTDFVARYQPDLVTYYGRSFDLPVLALRSFTRKLAN